MPTANNPTPLAARHGEGDSPAAAPETVEADAPCLYYTDGGRQRKLVLSTLTPRVLIGRAKETHVALTADRTASRLHSVMEWADGHWTIRDEGMSRNGTFVNGERLVGRRQLRLGDNIWIGNSLLAFRGPGDRRGEAGPVGLASQPTETGGHGHSMSTEEIKAHVGTMFAPAGPGPRRRGSGLRRLGRTAAA
ncbi:FHA domain-containing protein [Rhodococcus sp. NPDC058514]|uniref:FHA domain-containing protein n=1 Tax=unclassified Rhodococcus (in: high G+C Gram-positive bacteria) TaxID=192944 RepID=UPI003654A40F